MGLVLDRLEHFSTKSAAIAAAAQREQVGASAPSSPAPPPPTDIAGCCPTHLQESPHENDSAPATPTPLSDEASGLVEGTAQCLAPSIPEQGQGSERARGRLQTHGLLLDNDGGAAAAHPPLPRLSRYSLSAENLSKRNCGTEKRRHQHNNTESSVLHQKGCHNHN